MTVLRMLAFRPESAAAPGEPAAVPAVGRRAPAAGAGAAGGAFDGDWPSLVARLAVTGAARELARNSSLARHGSGILELVVPKSMAHLADRGYQEKLKSALEQHFGTPLALKVTAGEASAPTAARLEASEREARRAQAAQAVQGDRFVQELVDIFDAKVVSSSVKANPPKG
jgi:DNA polymerase-3 subunit gamma/tau